MNDRFDDLQRLHDLDPEIVEVLERIIKAERHDAVAQYVRTHPSWSWLLPSVDQLAGLLIGAGAMGALAAATIALGPAFYGCGVAFGLTLTGLLLLAFSADS